MLMLIISWWGNFKAYYISQGRMLVVKSSKFFIYPGDCCDLREGHQYLRATRLT